MPIKAFVAAAAGIVLLAVAAPGLGGVSGLPTGNLLQNPGAEAGLSGVGKVVPVPHWTTAGHFTVDNYGNVERLGYAAGTAIHGGKNYFYGGPATPFSRASQTVTVSAYAAQIDSKHVAAHLSGDLGGFTTQFDNGTLAAIFLDAKGKQLGAISVTGPGPAERHIKSILLARATSALLPVGTRTIRVVMSAARKQGSNDDATFDNLSLRLARA